MARIQRLPTELQRELERYTTPSYHLGATPAYRDTYLEYLSGMRPLREDIEHYRRGCNMEIKYDRTMRGPFISMKKDGKLVGWFSASSVIESDLVRFLNETEQYGTSREIKISPRGYLSSQTIHGATVLVRRWPKGTELVPYCTEVIEALLRAAKDNDRSRKLFRGLA